MAKEYICVVDRGTTSVKAVLFDLEGNEKTVIRGPGQTATIKFPGWYEQDMDKMWEDACLTIRGCVRSLDLSEKIVAVTVTGQGSGIFPVDKDGRPVRAGIASLDTRTEKMVDTARSSGIEEKWLDATDCQLLPWSPAMLLKWLKENESDSYKRIRHILFSKDWIRYKLTQEYLTDITDAAPPGLICKDEKSYFLEGFDLLNIAEKKEALPELRSSCGLAGYVTKEAAKETGLNEGIPVYVGAHDMMAGCMGIGDGGEDYLLSLVGTWGANYMVTSQKRHGLCISNPHIVPGKYVTGCLDGNSGAVLDRMLSIFYGRTDTPFKAAEYYEDAEQRACRAKYKDILFLPYLFDTQYSDKASGAFQGMKYWHNGDDYLASVYEGIVMGHYDNTYRYIEDAGKIRKIYLGGGGAGSRLFGQLFANIFNLPVTIPSCSELTARGAALAAIAGLGVRGSIEKAQIQVKTMRIFEPDQTEVYRLREKYTLFKKARNLFDREEV